MMDFNRHSPPQQPQQPPAKKPRGILKNAADAAPRGGVVVGKGTVVHNTQVNAGRKQSQSELVSPLASDDMNVSRLKWDEANLYLAEQEKTSKMKITEPKTPFPPTYNPDEDQEAEVDVPTLDLGPAEEDHAAAADPESLPPRKDSTSPKQVVVDDESMKDGEDSFSSEDEEKHKRFAEMRKKHYEMKDAIKLGHQLDELEDLENGEDEGPSIVSYNEDADRGVHDESSME